MWVRVFCSLKTEPWQWLQCRRESRQRGRWKKGKPGSLQRRPPCWRVNCLRLYRLLWFPLLFAVVFCPLLPLQQLTANKNQQLHGKERAKEGDLRRRLDWDATILSRRIMLRSWAWGGALGSGGSVSVYLFFSFLKFCTFGLNFCSFIILTP